MLKRGLTTHQAFLVSFLALALTAIASENIGPCAVAFAAEVRRGVTVDIFGYSIFVQENTIIVRAALYYGFYTIFFAGILSVGLWYLRWWTVPITILLGILVVSAGVFNNELSYAIGIGRAPRYPESLYWGLAMYYVAPIGTCLSMLSELGDTALEPEQSAVRAES